jgi:hypothetical protein
MSFSGLLQEQCISHLILQKIEGSTRHTLLLQYVAVVYIHILLLAGSHQRDGMGVDFASLQI